MKVVIAGTRTFNDYNSLVTVIQESTFQITELISGGCRGVDQLAEHWARENNIPIKQFLPDWARHGKAAGPLRNKAMAEYADAVICIWDRRSKGTLNMINNARQKKKGLYIHNYE